MNNVQLSGFISKEPETRGDGDKVMVRFTVACQRKYKNAEGRYDADFINCVAFGKTADIISKYFHKGSGVEISKGSINTGSYTNKDGNKVYTTDVKVDEVEFPKVRKGESGSTDSAPVSSPVSTPNTDMGFVNVGIGIDGELPFD